MTTNALITGWGMYAPSRVMTNEELSTMVETSDEWIVSRTGIRERRIAADDETTATLSVHASRDALAVAGQPREASSARSVDRSPSSSCGDGDEATHRT